MKRALTKNISRALLQYHEVEYVLFDAEGFMNNTALFYVEEELDHTTNILLRGSPAGYLRKDTKETKYQVFTRRMRYLSMCHAQLRKKW